jgi:hypothetical protein
VGGGRHINSCPSYAKGYEYTEGARIPPPPIHTHISAELDHSAYYGNPNHD